MFIATSAPPKDLAPLVGKPAKGTFAPGQPKAIGYTELQNKEKPPSHKHLAPAGAKR
jgi:hypothetical protein